MRNKIFIILITIVILLSFSLISCSQHVSSTTTTQNTATTKAVTATQEVTTTTVINNSGLSESQRKQAYYDLAVLQDSIAAEDPPDRSEKMTEAYSIIAKKYDITKDEMLEITAEGIEKNWPMPPVE